MWHAAWSYQGRGGGGGDCALKLDQLNMKNVLTADLKVINSSLS